MKTGDFIEIRQFCLHHEIEFSFISALHETGLIEMTLIGQGWFIPAEQVSSLEKMVRLHHDLGINIDGIGAVFHLLEKMDRLQAQIVGLQNRLRLYE